MGPASIATSTEAGLRLSATVLLLRETSGQVEVLMQRRAAALAFGGTWAFPGGAVEPADGDPVADLAATLRRAVARECHEEAGIQLWGESAATSLIGWSRWITPAGRTRRFDTWFFAAALPPGQAVVGDAVEAVESVWFAPAAAIEARGAGQLPMMPPALLSLIDLAHCVGRCGTLAAVLQSERARRTPPILPRLTSIEGQWVAVYPWDPDYERLDGPGIALGDSTPAHLRALPSRMALAPDYAGGLAPTV